jgi:hypothetical protein
MGREKRWNGLGPCKSPYSIFMRQSCASRVSGAEPIKTLVREMF